MKKHLFTILIVTISIGCKTHNNDDYALLFNGGNLEGWQVEGGQGSFSVEDGMIVGVSQSGIPNSFLVTEKPYNDFILELDFKVHPTLNTGVQIRSKVLEEPYSGDYLSGKLENKKRTFEAGRVHGYQIEIDPSERAWTGGFYEEAGRGWLQPLTDNEEARTAFKQNEWNHLKIKAEGNHFQSWINGVKAADYKDDLYHTGFIGLQLHEPYRDEQIGQKVYWKNIRLKEL
ncbi:MAG: 3-keto-disaccharide hydrolase [Candidatus Cyclobacteriaceae bacterium M3_2C_046]